MQDLPSEVARAVDTMKVGEISKPFQMINNNGKTTCAIVKLKNRIEGHKATITEDFQLMKDIVENKRKEEVIRQWVIKKIKNTYTRLNEQYKDCDFEYSGWIK
jgi:peptidyl-prolyl cis-trans isomerase SurA